MVPWLIKSRYLIRAIPSLLLPFHTAGATNTLALVTKQAAYLRL